MKELVIETKGFSKDMKKEIVSKLSYLGKQMNQISVLEDSIVLSLKDEFYESVQNDAQDIVEAVKETFRHIKEEVLFEHTGKMTENKEDTFELLKSKEMIFEFGKGLVGFGESFLRAQNLLDAIIVKWGKEYGSKEYSYPELIHLDTLMEYNYLKEFPQYLMFSSHLKNDIKMIQYFGKNCNTDAKEECYTDKVIERPVLANKTAVCPHVYKQFQGQVLDIEKPVVVSTVGRCKRYESANMNRCERLLDFTMREIVLLGETADILKIRDEFIQKVETLIEYLDVNAAIKSASDPFFSNEYKPKILLQRKLKLKYELDVKLSYGDDEIAVGSFNYHHDHFAQCFDLKGKEADLTTGCIAFGLERFVYALISQYGVEETDLLIEKLGEFYRLM